MLISDMVGSDRRSSQMGAESNGDVMQVTSRQLGDLFDFDTPALPDFLEPLEWTGVKWEWGETQCKAAIAAAEAYGLQRLEYESAAEWVAVTTGRCDWHLWQDERNKWMDEYVPCRCTMEG